MVARSLRARPGLGELRIFRDDARGRQRRWRDGKPGFEGAWEQFHEIFFSDNYRFNPVVDHLIQIYPEAFWENIVFFIGMLIVAEALLLLIGSIIYLGVTGHKRQPERRLATTHRALA